MDSNVLASFRADFREIERLLNVEDNSERPFDSKYQARKKLEEILVSLNAFQGPKVDALRVNLLARLGNVDHDVEELSESQKHLEEALLVAQNDLSSGKLVVPSLVCLNQLGVLWCKRGELEKAKEILLKALDAYRAFKSKEDQNLEDLKDLLEEQDNSEMSKKLKDLDLLNTHTYFYLAQVRGQFFHEIC